MDGERRLRKNRWSHDTGGKEFALAWVGGVCFEGGGVRSATPPFFWFTTQRGDQMAQNSAPPMVHGGFSLKGGVGGGGGLTTSIGAVARGNCERGNVTEAQRAVTVYIGD